MRIELKFTESKARNTFYFLSMRYGSKMKYSPENFAKLAKVAALTEAANEAKVHLERLEKLTPSIMVDGPEPATVTEQTEAVYGQADLGTRFCISGGEVLELDGRTKGGDEYPF